MDNKYITLFREIAHTTEILAENVMQYDKEKQDEDGAKTAEIMRDDFSKLYDKIRDPNFNEKDLIIEDFRRLLVGSLIVVNNINNKIEQQQRAINNYKIDIIPKLQRVIDEYNTPEEMLKLSEELFTINT